MKRELLVIATTLLFGTLSSVASAQSDSDAWRRHHRDSYDQNRDRDVDRNTEEGRGYYRDRGEGHWDGRGQSRWDDRDRGGWYTLAAPVPTANGRQFTNIGPAMGRFHGVALRMVRGAAFIHVIGVEFMDHTTQAITVDAWVSDRDPAIVIPFGRHEREINRVIVYTGDRSRGAYQLFAN
jgi:hypothetical protein